MHSLLENYLSEVEHSLRLLPKNRRTEELKEIRQHLQNAVTLYQEQGQPEHEAAQSAIAQFGLPDDLGESIAQTWRRGQILRRRDLWKSALCALLLSLLLPHILFPLYKQSWSNAFDVRNFMLGYLLLSLPFLLVGIISGLVLPRRAIAGTGLAVGVYIIYALTRLIITISLNHMSLWLLIQAAIDVFAAILGAWVGSRGRGRQARLTVR